VIFFEGSGKNGSTVAVSLLQSSTPTHPPLILPHFQGTSVIFPLFPILATSLPFIMLYCKSASGVYEQNITLLLLCYGAVAAKASNRLVIAYMSKSPLELWDWVYLSPFVMILNQYYDFHFNEYYLLVTSTVLLF
jgi:ethanolaminephosphotransferase